MPESITITQGLSKAETYQSLLPQVEALMQGEPNLIANLANVCAAIHQTFNFHWTGFYFADKDELVLGPFQGPVACTRIPYGKGVCGTAWQKKQTIIVDDVNAFPGHIACSALSQSEIVVPVIKDNQVLMVLDIDSKEKASFNHTDQQYLEKFCAILANLS